MKNIPFFEKTKQQQVMSKANLQQKVKQFRRIRLLAWMDSPTCATGFGNVSKYLLAGLYQTGLFDITVLAINHSDLLTDPRICPYNIVPARSMDNNDVYGYKTLIRLMKDYDFEYLFIMNDTAVADTIVKPLQELKTIGKSFKTIFYFPIDQEDQARYTKMIDFADLPVAYSQYAVNCCKKFTKTEIQYNYLGIDKNIFKPIPREQILSFRKETFKTDDDTFLIVNVNRNSFRKDIAHNILCFSEFRKIVPNSKLYLHTAVVDKGAGSMAPLDLKKAIFSCGLESGKDVMFPQNFNPAKGVPFEVLNLVYNSANLVMSTHLGEGALKKGTLINTENGFVPIENITDKDRVLTHLQRYMPVTKTMSIVPEEIIKLRLYKFNEPLFLTKDHPVLTKRGFVQAQDLNKFDKVIFTKSLKKKCNLERIDLSEFIKDKTNYNILEDHISLINQFHGKRIARYLPINEDTMWLFGMYIGDGSKTSQNNLVRGIQFSQHENEKENHIRIENIINKYINIFGDYASPKFNKSNTDKSGNIVFNNSLIGDFFNTLFGENCYTKKIPYFLLGSSLLNLDALLNGLLDSDGDGPSKDNRNWQLFRYKTVSPYLAYSVRDLLIHLGYIPSVSLEDNSKGYSNRTIFSIIVIKKGSHYKNPASTCFSSKHKNYETFIELDILSIDTIKNKEKENYYDLQIPGDNSYVTSVCTVHNCGLTSIEAACTNVPVLVPDNTVSPELLGDTAILYPCKEQVWTDGSSGFRPRGRTEDIVKQMLYIYNNKENLKQDNSLLYEKFSWQKIIKKWLDMFIELENKKSVSVSNLKVGEEL